MGAPGMANAARGVSLAMDILCTLVCCLRVYMRRAAIKSVELDDYLVMVALGLVNAYSALTYALTYYGLGRHQEDVTSPELVVWMKIYYVLLCISLVASAAVKLSLTAFIMRLFPEQYIKFTGRSIVAFLVLFATSGELVLAFQCDPVRAFWESTSTASHPGPSCFSADTMFGIHMYQDALMFAVDSAIITFPIPVIRPLQMSAKNQALVLFLFGLGTVPCAAALVRVILLARTRDEDTDITYKTTAFLLCTIIELTLILLVTSLASLYQFPSGSTLHQARPRTRHASSHPHSATVYELDTNKRRRKRGDGILKISEVHTSFHEYRASMFPRPESQERIVTGNGIYGLGFGNGGWGSVRVHVSSSPRY
ncbi:hypothetical protein BDW62DRAFT_207792 [Aspergillus aurantiobrunneus]